MKRARPAVARHPADQNVEDVLQRRLVVLVLPSWRAWSNVYYDSRDSQEMLKTESRTVHTISLTL